MNLDSNNSDADINVGNLKFQPMPKRFIAWDKHKKDWVTKFLMPSISDESSDDYTCPLTLGINSKGEKDWLNNDQLIICQSTDLFDKDGREIFEGSIVEANWGFNTGSTYLDYNIVGIVKNLNGVWCIAENNSDTDGKMLCELNPEDLNILGHILSSPELLEEE